MIDDPTILDWHYSDGAMRAGDYGVHALRAPRWFWRKGDTIEGPFDSELEAQESAERHAMKGGE